MMKMLVLGITLGLFLGFILASAAVTWVVEHHMLPSVRSWAEAAFENGEATATWPGIKPEVREANLKFSQDAVAEFAVYYLRPFLLWEPKSRGSRPLHDVLKRRLELEPYWRDTGIKWTKEEPPHDAP